MGCSLDFLNPTRTHHHHAPRDALPADPIMASEDFSQSSELATDLAIAFFSGYVSSPMNSMGVRTPMLAVVFRIQPSLLPCVCRQRFKFRGLYQECKRSLRGSLSSSFSLSHLRERSATTLLQNLEIISQTPVSATPFIIWATFVLPLPVVAVLSTSRT
jgi:hypothetical protein